MSRTLEQVQAEYIELAKQAGDMSYRIKCFEADLERVHNRMLELNQEATKLGQQESANEQAPEQAG